MEQRIKQYINQITLRLNDISSQLDDCDNEVLHARLTTSWEELVIVGNRLNAILEGNEDY